MAYDDFTGTDDFTPGGATIGGAAQDDIEDRQAQAIAASRPLPTQAIGNSGGRAAAPISDEEDTLIPSPGAQPPMQAAPSSPRGPWDPFKDATFVSTEEQPDTSQDAGVVSELGSGLARGFKHTAAEVGDLAATAASKTGDWTDTTWLKNLGSTISDYDKGLTKVDPSAISSMTMAQARAKGVMTAWLVGKAAEQAVPLTSIIAMGTAMPLAPIIYGAAVGANEEAKNPDATGGSVATAAIGNAAMMGMPIHILQSAVGQTFFKKLAADVLGFAGLGAAGEFQEPATKAARGEGFEMPSLGQLGEGAVIGGMSGAMARPAQVGVNAVSRMLGRGKAGQPPPPADADVQAATQQALPPPSPENRPDVMNVPPTGPDQMSPSDIIPPAAGTLDRPGDIAAANVDPSEQSALRFMLPPPSDANRAPAPDVVNVPPTGPGQVSASDIIPPPAGSVDYPPSPPPPTPPPGPLALPAPPPTPALPAPGPENRPPPAPEARPTMPVAPEAGQVSAADIMPPPAGTVDYPPPPVQQLALPAPDRASTVSMPGRVPGETDAITPPPGTVDYPTDVSFQMPAALRMKLSQPERWQVEPDDATPGQYVVKHGNDVLAVGSSPEEAMQAAHDRAQRLEVGGAPTDIGTGAEATTSSEPGTTPIVASENTPEIPPPPVEPTPKQARRSKLKPAAQEVLSKADQKLAAARAAGEGPVEPPAEPKAASAPETPPALAKLVKKSVAAKAAPEPAPEPASALVRETPAQRKARIAREVKGEFGDTAEPPAGATPAARGMENIDLVSAAAGTRDPREAARARDVETTGDNPELKSDQRAASTTELRLRAGDALHDVLKGSMKPHEAYERYGQPAGTGRPRRYATFLDYLKSRIENASDPDALSKLAIEARTVNEDSKLSVAEKKNTIEAIGREIDRHGIEQEKLPEIKNILGAVMDYVGPVGEAAPEAEPEVKPKQLTQDQLLQKMKDANARKKAGTLKSSFSSYERGSHLDVLERLYPNENVEDRLAHTAETGVPHDMHAYLDDIINGVHSRVTPHLLAVARVLRKRLAPGIMVHADPHLDAYGEYNPDTDAVTIRPDMGVSVRTIVHEALHAGTAHFLTDVGTRLRDGKPVTPDERRAYRALDAVGHEIDGISSGAVQMTRAGEAARDARQYRNHHELITYAMTDPHLLGLMANTDASPMLLRRLKQVGLEPVGPKPSLLAAFKTAIGKLFGLTPDRVSVLDAVMRPIERAVEMGTDYRSERTGPGERTPVLQSKLTDNLPDPLRQKLSGFGDIVEGFNRDGLLGKTRDLIREIPRYGRQAGLMASGTNSAVRWNRDIPGLKMIRDLRALAERKSKDAQLQWGDRVHDYAQELARAGTAFSDFRNRVSMAEVNVRDPDFNRANAHLRTDEARQLGLELKAEHDRLPPELQQLHNNITTMEARWRYDQDRGWMEHLLRRAGGDLTKEDLSELAHIVGDKAKMDQLAKDPDQSHLADLMADRWAAVRPIAQQFAKIQSAGWRHGDFTSLQRHGDYVVTHGDPEIPEHYGVYAFERSSQAEQFRQDFMKNPENAGITPSQVKIKFAAGSNRYREFMPSTMETELKRTLELRGIRGEAADGFMDAFTAYLLQSGARASALRSVARRNITGASTDGMKNLIRNYQAHASRMGHLATAADEYAAYQQTENQVRQVERAYHGTPQEIAESKARLVALEQRYANKDPEVSQAEIEDRRRQHELLSKPLGRGDAMRARQAFEEMKLRRAPVDGDDSARLFGVTARKFMATSFVTQLVRPAHLAVMSLDAANNAQAYLGAEYGHGRAAVALGRALKQLTPTGMGAGWGNMVKAFHGQMRQADWRVSQQMEQRWIDTGMDKDDAHALMEYARDRNAVDTSMERETHRFATEGGLDVALGHASRIANNMMTLFASAEHSLDTLNRSIILKAGYDLALEKNGGDKAAAIRAAVDHVDDAMMNFAAWNKPRVMTERGPIKNPLVAATMQYKVYGAQMYSHMATLAMEAATDPARRSVAIQSLAGMLAINSLLIGVTANMFGVPINAITGLWDMVNGKSGPHNYENDLRRWATHTLGPTASAFLSRGLIGVAGADLHRSLKRSNMVDVPELRDFTKAGVGAFFAQGLTGASGELAGQYVDATSKMFNGNFAQGALELMPRPIADVSRAYHEATTGVTDAKGNVIVPASRLSILTPIIRGIGFNPTAVATPLANRAAENEFERERTDARNKAEAAFVQDRDMSRVRAFNVDKELNGGVPIKPADLLRALKTQQDRLATPGTYGLRFPKALVPAATRAGQFS